VDGRVAEMAPFDETTLVLALVKEKGSWWSQIKERSGTGYRIGAISEEPNSVLYLHSTVLYYLYFRSRSNFQGKSQDGCTVQKWSDVMRGAGYRYS
jgi:hypothetical protein